MRRLLGFNVALAWLVLITGLSTPIAMAGVLPVPPVYQERLDTLTAEYEALEAELQALESDMQSIAEPQASDKIADQQVERLFALMEELAVNRKAIQALKTELPDLFTAPPPLKLVRISGPESGSRDSGMGQEAEIVYTPNSSGFTWHERTTSGRTVSTMGMAVTYAPLEIVPGEPFHFEAEVRQAYDWDKPDCTGSSPFRIHIGINPDHDILGNSEFDFQGWPVAVSRQDLRCEPGSVNLALRFQADPPEYLDPFSVWLFPYNLEATTNGTRKENSAFRASIKDTFKLESRKSAIGLADRELYKYDVDVSPGPSSFGGAKITLHYRPVDDSIAFLPLYQFPEDAKGFLITVPDVQGLSETEAIKALTMKRLDARVIPGDSPEHEEYAGKVAEQRPLPGERLKAGSKIDLTIHSDFIATSRVPDVQGMKHFEASQEIEARGLFMDRREAGRPDEPELANTVQKQEPLAGAIVEEDRSVRVWVYGSYIQTRDEQIAATDCTRYGGSVAVWDESENRPLCGCPEGLTWSADRTHCEKLIPPEQLCISHYPGSVPTGRDSTGKVNCGCPNGYTWSTDRTHCEKLLQPGQICARDFPRSIANGRLSDGRINCECPAGFAWSNDRTNCEKLLPPEQICTNHYPGSVPTGRDSTGKVNCGCPNGYTWSTDRTHCEKLLQPGQICARDFPGSIANGRLSDGRINCECPQGYGWTTDRKRCVAQAHENTGNKNQRCRDLIFEVKSFMGVYRLDPQNNSYPKSLAEGFAQQARALGCDRGQINQALGTGGGTGSGTGGGTRCVCPSGTVPSETFGQSGCIDPNTGRKMPEVCS